MRCRSCWMVVALVAGSLSLVSNPSEAHTGSGGSHGPYWQEAASFSLSEWSEGDQFGAAVAVDGDTAMISAPRSARQAADSAEGSVFVYGRTDSGWMRQQELTASVEAAKKGFGQTIALEGDVAAIGSDAGSQSEGMTTLFTRTNGSWSAQTVLKWNDGSGQPVDVGSDDLLLSGDTLLAAWSIESGAGANDQAALVFTRSGGTWSLQQDLTADASFYASDVALDGDTILIGDVASRGTSREQGKVFVYTRNGETWGEETVLEGQGAWFGSSVALEGDTAAVGRNVYDVEETGNTHAAFIYSRSGGSWSLQETLEPCDDSTLQNEFQEFGGSIAIAGEEVLVGDDEQGIYSFRRTNGSWYHNQKIHRLSNPLGGGRNSEGFSSAFALDTDTVFIGEASLSAKKNDAWKKSVGVAYALERAPAPPQGSFVCEDTGPTGSADAGGSSDDAGHSAGDGGNPAGDSGRIGDDIAGGGGDVDDSQGASASSGSSSGCSQSAATAPSGGALALGLLAGLFLAVRRRD